MKYYFLLLDEFLLSVHFILCLLTLGSLPTLIIAYTFFVDTNLVKIFIGCIYITHLLYMVFTMEKPSKVNQYRHKHNRW